MNSEIRRLKQELSTERRFTNKYIRLNLSSQKKLERCRKENANLRSAIKEIAEYAPYLPDRDIRVILALCRKALS